MNHTNQYQLNQWEPEDRILREDFNADNLKMEAALAELTGRLPNFGNCEMEVITYTGTGAAGSPPTKINFSQQPEIFFVAGDMSLVLGRAETAGALLICKDATYSESFVANAGVSWNGSQLLIENGVNARYQMNTKGKPYWALGLRRKA